MKNQNLILLAIIILIIVIISIILINNSNDDDSETCDYDSEIKKYEGRSEEECALISILCAPDYKYFADECGCGCELN